MTELRYPKAIWRPIPSHGDALTMDAGVVEHITTNNDSPYGYFSNPNNQASSHFWIGLDGTVEQYIDLRLRSWAQAGGNSRWVSVEIAGVEGSLKTDAQCEAFAGLIAWGSEDPELNWPLTPTDDPSSRGVGWHGMGGQAWGGHLYCPGKQRVDQTRQTVIPRARQFAGITPTESPVTDAEIAKIAAACRAEVQQDLRVVLHGLKDAAGNETHPANVDAIYADVEAIKQHLGIA